MNKQLEALIADMKAAAEKATPLQLDTAQIVRGNGGSLECPCCEGAGYVEEENDFCNIDGEPLGVQFYGIGGSFGLAEEYFRKVSPGNLKALITALEQSQQSGFNEEVLAQEERAENAEAEIVLLKERIAELEATLERERERSRRVMSRNHQPEASPLAVKLPEPSAWRRDSGLFGGFVVTVSGKVAEHWQNDNQSATPMYAHADVIEAIRAAGGTVEGE